MNCVCVCWENSPTRGVGSVPWQVVVFQTGTIFSACVACLVDIVCLARKDKKTYGHIFLPWACMRVPKCVCVCVFVGFLLQKEVASQLRAWEKRTWQWQTVET